jgi:23S rRNA (cytidine1920-2'-O)/16S rRNA (cytidine1409-2'-O)-methyltransferase
MPQGDKYVGRGGHKLEYALEELELDLEGLVGADFGCSIGGFTDCMLQRGVVRVYAVDTGYGMLAWKLRQDERVEVMERTNAMHVELPEPVDVLTVDVAWTRQRYILPNALEQSKSDAAILALFKPQYEAAEEQLEGGRIVEGTFNEILEATLLELQHMGIRVSEVVELPRDPKRNPEAMLYVEAAECDLMEEFRPEGEWHR